VLVHRLCMRGREKRERERERERESVCVCVCARARTRAFVRACVYACVCDDRFFHPCDAF
jgi:hypothetical protein